MACAPATLWAMFEDEYLTLGRAEAEYKLPKRELRRLVRTGRLPAIRKDGRWHIHRSDLTPFEVRAGKSPEQALRRDAGTPTPALPGTARWSPASTADVEGRPEMLALIELLKQRDDRLAELQDERVRLASQVGYLQAQLAERDARLRLLEAGAIEPSLAEGRLHAEAGGEQPASVEPSLDPEPRPAGANEANGSEPSTLEIGGAGIAPGALAGTVGSLREHIPGDPRIPLQRSEVPSLLADGLSYPTVKPQVVDPAAASILAGERRAPASLSAYSNGAIPAADVPIAASISELAEGLQHVTGAAGRTPASLPEGVLAASEAPRDKQTQSSPWHAIRRLFRKLR
jgi:hypothetical protein